MIEVHPPHSRISGFRDFLIHILTITVGLLIALGLEAAVERVHQRQLRIEANESIRREIERNRDEVREKRKLLASEKQNVIDTLKYLRARVANQPIDVQSLVLAYTGATLKEAAWNTASVTGTLALMGSDQVEKFETAYQEQSVFQGVQRQTLTNILTLQAYFYDFNPKTFPAGEAEAAERDARLTLSELQALDQLSGSLDQTYETSLK